APPPDSHSVWENGGVVWARASKALYAGSIPASASRAVSSAGERFPDTEEVTGSIPVPPTMFAQVEGRSSNTKTGLLDHLSAVCHQDMPGRGNRDQAPRTPRAAVPRLCGLD